MSVGDRHVLPAPSRQPSVAGYVCVCLSVRLSISQALIIMITLRLLLLNSQFLYSILS
jgi:hypothetical protein